MKTLSLSRLRKLKACEPQVKLFADLFGDSAVVAPELCALHAEKFDWGWAAAHLLTPAQRSTYDAALADAGRIYDAATDEPGRIYCAATADAFCTAYNS